MLPYKYYHNDINKISIEQTPSYFTIKQLYCPLILSLRLNSAVLLQINNKHVYNKFLKNN